jgi:hypothetical protein
MANWWNVINDSWFLMERSFMICQAATPFAVRRWYKHIFILIVATGIVYFSVISSVFAAPRLKEGVNSVLGDESFVAVMGKKPTAEDSEQLRLRTHLQYVEKRLRAADVHHLSKKQRAARSLHLQHLHEYLTKGKFPHNHLFAGRRPHFIDEEGRICAVGYLVETSVGRNVAEQLNREFEWAYVQDIRSSIFDSWAKQAGFSKKELAMIQPSYGFMRPHLPKPHPPPPRMLTKPEVHRVLAMMDSQIKQCQERNTPTLSRPSFLPEVSVLVTFRPPNAKPFLNVRTTSNAASKLCIKTVVDRSMRRFRRHQVKQFIQVSMKYARKDISNTPKAEPLLKQSLSLLGQCIPSSHFTQSVGNYEASAVLMPSGRFTQVRVRTPPGVPTTIKLCMQNIIKSQQKEAFVGNAVRAVVPFLIRLQPVVVTK